MDTLTVLKQRYQELQAQTIDIQNEKTAAEQKYYNIKANFKELIRQLREADVDVGDIEEDLASSESEMDTVMRDRDDFELE